VRSIKLSGLSLTEFPDFICSLEYVQEIDVSNNKIDKIPAEKICSMTNLKSILLQGNLKLYSPPPELTGGVECLEFMHQCRGDLGRKSTEMLLVVIGNGEAVSKQLLCDTSVNLHLPFLMDTVVTGVNIFDDNSFCLF
jgi:hypothetical protein